MKRMLSILGIAAAATLFVAAQSYAAEGVTTMENKDECLLVAMNCKDRVDTIQQRIDRLNKEITKGTDVYTRDELRILEKKLADTERELEFLVQGG